MIAVNAAAQVGALGGIILIQTAYAIIVARVLGVEDFGRFTFIFSITQILLIGCDLGLHNTAIRKISARPEESPSLFSTFLYLKTFVSALLFLGLAFFALLLAQEQETRIAFILFGAGMFFNSMNSVLNVTFQAHGKLYLGSLNQLLISLFTFLMGVSSLWLGGRIISLALAYALGSLGALAVNRRIFTARIHAIRIDRQARWEEFAWESLPVGLGTLFNTISGRIGILLLTWLEGSYQTGIYSAAFRIHAGLGNVPLGIFSAVLPAMASFGEDRLPVRRLFAQSLAVMIALSVPLAVGLFLGADPLIQLLYGKDYQPSADNLRILAWAVIPTFVGMAFSHVMLSQATLLKWLPRVAAFSLLLNIACNLALIPWLGSVGAAVGTLVTETVLALLYAVATVSFLRFEPERHKGPEEVIN